MTLSFGCASADITPPFPVYLRGYSFRNRCSEGVEDSLEVGAMVLRQSGKSLLLVTVDSLGIELGTCARLYGDLEAATGFGADDVYLCCSHTHFAPGFSPYYVCMPGGEIPLGRHPAEEGYYPLFLNALLSAVKEAQGAMEDVEVEEASIPLNELLFNRRTLDKATGKVVTMYRYPPPEFDGKLAFQATDSELMVWRFRGGDGALKGILGRYGCHPVVGGRNPYALSADYPGHFRKHVQELFGCPGFFMLGCAGDVVPMQREGESRDDIGRIMASSIRLAERRFRGAGQFKLSHGIVPVPLKLRVTCSRARGDALLARAIDAVQASPDRWLELEAFHYAHANVKAHAEDTVEMPLRLMRLGTKILVGMPFEVLTAIGARLRRACPDAVVTSITGGYEGYLPLARDFRLGGYETVPGAQYQKNAGDIMLSAAIRAVKEFAAG